MKTPLYVTRPMLPELADLEPMLKKIWSSQIVTNGGPYHNRLEAELRTYLGVETAMLFNNGTIALLAALKMLGLPAGSEVITTPLTFAATAHAISWNELVPVFADVDPVTLTLDPKSVEKAITKKTSAIVGVHVYGTVCDVEALQAVADENSLRLIYDGAHAFGTVIGGKPVAQYGDGTVFSFHATKLFTTLEGGLIATTHADLREKIYFLRNFGIKNEEEVVSVGINGKMNEIQAAVGLLNLPMVAEEVKRRAQLRKAYNSFLSNIPGIRIQPAQNGVTNSEQYYPIVIDRKEFGRSRDEIYDALRSRKIFARKYFHPICTDFEPYRDFPIISANNRVVAEVRKSQVLCLPFFGGVTEQEIAEIQEVFLHGLANYAS